MPVFKQHCEDIAVRFLMCDDDPRFWGEIVTAVIAKAHCRMQIRCYDTEVDLQDDETPRSLSDTYSTYSHHVSIAGVPGVGDQAVICIVPASWRARSGVASKVGVESVESCSTRAWSSACVRGVALGPSAHGSEVALGP